MSLPRSSLVSTELTRYYHCMAGEDTHGPVRPRKQFPYRITSNSPTLEGLDFATRNLGAQARTQPPRPDRGTGHS